MQIRDNIWESDDFNTIYVEMIRQVYNNGIMTKPRGLECKEVRPAMFNLKNPRKRVCCVAGRKYNIGFALAEVLWILLGRGDAEFIGYYNKQMLEYFDDKDIDSHGSYGVRLRHYGSQELGDTEHIYSNHDLDQLKSVYKKLIADPETRQAVLMIWNPLLDLNKKTKDVPCNSWSHLTIRDNKLNWCQVLRSNDILWGTPYNVMQFTMLQEVIAGWLSVDVGTYTHFTDSLHCYTSRENEIKTILNYYNAKHPYDNESIYDSIIPNDARLSYKASKKTINLLGKEEEKWRKGKCDFSYVYVEKFLKKIFFSGIFWQNFAQVLISYSAFKHGLKDDAIHIALGITNEFRLSLLEFYLRKALIEHDENSKSLILSNVNNETKTYLKDMATLNAK